MPAYKIFQSGRFTLHETCSADGSKLPEFVEISTFAPKAAQNVVAILKLVEAI